MNDKKKLILVLEDNEIHRQLIVDGLEDRGFEVVSCADIETGKRMLEKEVRPDLFVLDLNIQGHDVRGVEFAGEVRRQRPDAAILLVTAYTHLAEEARKRELLAGVEILPKPFNYERLFKKIREVMAASET